MKRRTGRCQFVTVDIDGQPTEIRIQASGDMNETELGYLAEVIAAAKRKFAAEPPIPDLCDDCGIRTTAPGHDGHHRRMQARRDRSHT